MTGGRKRRVADEGILRLFDETTDPVLSTAEVADALPIGRRGVLNRLHELDDRGELEHKDVGGRNIVWWRPENRIASGLSEITERSPDRPPETQGEGTEDTGADTSEATDNAENAELRAELEDVEFPQGRDREKCIEAVLAARDYLQEEGKAGMRDFVREVMPDHPLGYDVPQLEPGDRYRGAWWRRVLKPGLQALPDVEPPAPGQSKWRFTP